MPTFVQWNSSLQSTFPINVLLLVLMIGKMRHMHKICMAMITRCFMKTLSSVLQLPRLHLLWQRVVPPHGLPHTQPGATETRVSVVKSQTYIWTPDIQPDIYKNNFECRSWGYINHYYVLLPGSATVTLTMHQCRDYLTSSTRTNTRSGSGRTSTYNSVSDLIYNTSSSSGRTCITQCVTSSTTQAAAQVGHV